MEIMKYHHSLFLLILVSFAYSKPEGSAHREDEHYKDGKHNDEYDHKTFLGESQRKMFEQLSPEESAERLGKLVDKIDKNKDGNISESELTEWIKYISMKEAMDSTKERLQKYYSKVMKDDNLISWEEYFNKNFPGPKGDREESAKKRIERSHQKFEAADENKDGKLSSEEYMAFAKPHLFARMYEGEASYRHEDMDLDKDGVVTLADLQEGARFSEDECKQVFETRDTNHNGQLEKSEIQQWYFPTAYDINQNEAKHLIHHADTNKDGNLTKKEIVDNHDIFVGSKATQWGKTLKRLNDEL